MKLTSVLTFIALSCCATISLPAQAPSPDATVLLSPDDLQQLVAPIALYPDPLIALILQGSTTPTDIVLADRYIQNNGDPNAIDSQNWDDSVKGLARYPDVLQMMDDNLDWTNQLGAAVLAQQGDVMTAIQAQRATAQSLGNLTSTPQQQVVDDSGAIEILPADPNVIYVPVYDPTVVYVQRPSAVPFITFSIGFAMGAWINGDCDWHSHVIYGGGYYQPGYGWRPSRPNNIIIWRPNPSKPRPRPPYIPNRPGNGGPGKLPGWQRPPGGTKPPPGRPGNPGGGKPTPTPRPQPPATRPPGNTKPAPVRPAPPTTRPTNPTPPTRPGTSPGLGKPSSKPIHTLPAQPSQPQIQPVKPQPRPQPTPTRPAPTPRPSTPTTKPAFDQQRPNTKRPTPSASASRPAPSARPAPATSPATARMAPAQRTAPTSANKSR